MVDKTIKEDYVSNRDEWRNELDEDIQEKYKSVSRKPGEKYYNLYDKIATLREKGRW